MELSVTIWFAAFVIAAVLFFGTAVVITTIGIRDLKDLLSRSARVEQNQKLVNPDI